MELDIFSSFILLQFHSLHGMKIYIVEYSTSPTSEEKTLQKLTLLCQWR